jgi:hypothetical protein
MSTPSSFRTDRNNNPTAFTTDIAIEGGLVQGRDFVQGDPFSVPNTAYSGGTETFYTAKLIGDPIVLTIGVIDKIGFRVGSDPYKPRWTYINLPYDLWQSLTSAQKRQVIGDMYACEGGTAMKPLFAIST